MFWQCRADDKAARPRTAARLADDVSDDFIPVAELLIFDLRRRCDLDTSRHVQRHLSTIYIQHRRSTATSPETKQFVMSWLTVLI